jgi:hypothetical protein
MGRSASAGIGLGAQSVASKAERVVAGGKMIEVARVRITEEGRRVLTPSAK